MWVVSARCVNGLGKVKAFPCHWQARATGYYYLLLGYRVIIIEV